jgi:hypothetical protein
MADERSRPSLRLRLKRFAVLAAYKQAVERAEQHQARGHRWRARRAQQDVERLRARLHALGGQVPPERQLVERITAFVQTTSTETQSRDA